MEEVNFEEVEGFDVPGALNGEKVEIPSGNGVNNSESVTEHVYVVFSENITIENGIKLIEDNVLSGEKLEVTRQDETGHAIVCVVNTAERRSIEQLTEVERVKVETTARPTDNNEKQSGEDNTQTEIGKTTNATDGDDTKTSNQAVQNEEQSKKNSESKQVSSSVDMSKEESEVDSSKTNKTEQTNANESIGNTDANESSVNSNANESSVNSNADESSVNTNANESSVNSNADESSENTDEEAIDSEATSSEVAASVYDDSQNTGSKPSPFVGVTVVAAIAIVAIGAAIIFRKK
ncbi:hypothetical protein [Butyrivibrio sp. JL13D10]|uniref:hypothetical protein n=1 Tax=Butyrivibrio sp. JL13D10 TaxID=3236815 RepID=UPI0038B5C928